MGTIQAGQILKPQISQPSVTRSGIQAGRVLSGISSYDEQLRQQAITQQKELSINQRLKNLYDTEYNKVKDMNYFLYRDYYSNIPESVRSYFPNPDDMGVPTEAIEAYNTFKQNITMAEARIEYLTKKVAEEDYNIQDQINQHNASGEHDARARRYNYLNELEKLIPYTSQAKNQFMSNMEFINPNQIVADQLQQQKWSQANTEFAQQRLEDINSGKIQQISNQLLPNSVTSIGIDLSKATPAQVRYYTQPSMRGLVYDTSKSSTSIMNLPPNVISPDLSQARQNISLGEKLVYDKFGKIKGVESSYFGKTMDVDTYNKQIEKLNKPTQTNQLFTDISNREQRSIMQPQNFLTVTKSPSLTDVWGYNIKKEGYVKGTLKFAGERLAGLYDIAQQRGYTSSYQQEPIRNLLQLTPQALYFTPAGSALMAIGGTESVIRGKTIPEKIMGGGEAVLGLIGLKGELGQLKSVVEASKFEKAPTYIRGFRIETPTGGLDIIQGKKVVGKNVYESFIRQPFTRVGEEGKIVAEEGMGLATKYVKGKPSEIISFETGGRSVELGNTPRLTRIKDGISITTPLEAETSASRIYTKTKFEGKLTQEGNKYFAFGKEVNAKPVYETYVGLGKQNEDVISIVAGKAQKARMNIITGEKTIVAKPSIFGKIKNINVGDTSGSYKVFTSDLGTGLKTAQKLDTSTIGLVSKGISKFKPEIIKYPETIQLTKSVELARPEYIGGGEIGKVMTSKYANQGNVFEDTYVPSTISTNLFKPTAESKQISISIQTPSYSTSPLVSELPSFNLPQKEIQLPLLKQPQIPKLREPQIVKPIQVPKQINIPKLIETPRNILIPRTNEKTKTPTPKLTTQLFNIKKTKKLTKKEEQLLTKAFTVLIRSKGKVLEVGKGLPYGKALKLGVEKTKSSLAQTFALRESGTTRLTDINYRVPVNLFTTPKRSKTQITPLTFVESRGKTLTTGYEIGGLQREKKSKSKKLKWM